MVTLIIERDLISIIELSIVQCVNLRIAWKTIMADIIRDEERAKQRIALIFDETILKTWFMGLLRILEMDLILKLM